MDIEGRFMPHPASAKTANDMMAVRIAVNNHAGFLNIILPEGREKSIVMTKLEEVLFWANAALARNASGPLSEQLPPGVSALGAVPGAQST